MEITADLCDKDGEFYINGQWGEHQSDGTFQQYGKAGDFVCQNTTDKTDIWIVARGMYVSTYEVKVKVETHAAQH